MYSPSSRSQSGNVFFAIFGAVALVGVLTAGVATFVKGPLATSVKITRQNTAENQMSIAGQVAVMAAANTASSGDCDADGFVEPIEWREDLTKPFPVGGGLIPSTIGISKKDPWGTEYGYCVWDHGPSHNGAGSCGGATQKRLEGTDSKTYSAVALVSAGPDKTFTTTCRTFDDADVNNDGDLETVGVDLPLVGKANPQDDDIIFTYTYEEATGASGGLWSLKSGDPGTAVINKKLETQGSASFAGGVLLPDSSLITCDATTAGVMAKNASGNGIDICDGAGSWASISGGGGAANAFDPNATCTVAADAGKVRYNTVSGRPEFCNGTQWLPFTINIPGVNLVITPNQQNAMNVDGGNNLDTSICTGPSGYICGAGTSFTVTNQGTLTSSTVSIRIVQIVNGVTQTILGANLTSVTNASNFVVTSNTCTTTLAPNATCVVTVKPKGNGNVSYTADLRVIANNNPVAIMQGLSNNFGCVLGRVAPGGIYVACGLTSPRGTYDLIITPGNCTSTTTNPTCSGTGYDGIYRTWGGSGITLPRADNFGNDNAYDGEQATVDIMAMGSLTGVSFPAISHCDSLIFSGYDDWYLPAYYEWQNYLVPNRAILTGMYLSEAGAANDYWTSTVPGSPGATDPYNAHMADSAGNGYTAVSRGGTNIVRCLRREGTGAPAPTTDTDPNAVGLTPAVTFTPSAVGRSNTVTVAGILQTITVSMSGGTGMNIIKNGVSVGASTVSGIKPSDTLAFEMNAPAVLGTKSTATINIGSDSYSWWVGYADSSRQAKVFMTSGVFNTGNFGGLTGMDAICTSYSALSTYGLSSSWKAMASDSTTAMANRIPWNWGTLKTLTGTVVANSYQDLLDGTLQAPMNVMEDGVSNSSYGVATGSNAYGQKQGTTAAEFHNDWTYYGCTGGISGAYGNSASTSQWAYIGTYNGNCGNVRLYCIEDLDSTSDTTPNKLLAPYKVQVATSSRQTSAAITISGMSAAATQTLSVSGGGTPRFKKNGGSEVSSDTVTNGDSVELVMDAPATGNSFNKMTITAGSMTDYWRVWSGDTTGSLVKRVFVHEYGYGGAGTNQGGVSGADSLCQSLATGAALGGTWKAIASGTGNDENQWAVNRIGYNWSTLRRIDGVDVVTAGNIWSTETTPLLAPIVIGRTGATVSTTVISTGSTAKGRAAVPTASGQCSGFSEQSSGVSNLTALYRGTSGSTSSNWIYNGGYGGYYYGCHSYELGGLYCIEQ